MKRIIIGVIVLFIIIILILIIKKSYSKVNTMNVNKVYELEAISRQEIYKSVKLNNLFKKYPKKVKGLRFGYICPGAMKTIDFLNKQITKNQNVATIVKQLTMLTDFQFFVEIYVLYKDYLAEPVRRDMMSVLKNNSCKISKVITKEITRLFGELPKNIRQNLPDDFYHIRHNTLVCSKDKELAKERINLLKSIYGSIESFNNRNQFTKCLGKRDGVSGCRDCCNSHFSQNYGSCVRECMDF